MADILFAGGFARPFTNDADEIKAANESDWHPSSVDFEATASASGGGTKVGSLADVLAFLKGKSAGTVTELYLLGHATTFNNGAAFALGGTITAPAGKQQGSVRFTSYIDDAALTRDAAKIAEVQPAFAKGAKIILVGCDAGLASSYLDRFANAFGVCVLGFSDKVWTGFTTASGSPPRIQSRGHVFVDSAGLLSLGAQFAPRVDTWSRDVKTLTPTSKSKNCP